MGSMAQKVLRTPDLLSVASNVWMNYDDEFERMCMDSALA